jgi:hypothetical protein
MNPNGERTPGSPSFEIPPAPSPEGEAQHEHAVEAPAAQPETVGKQAPKPVPLPPVPDDVPAVDQPVIAAPPADATVPMATSSHAPASDTDRIEPVWVNRIRDTVARTHDDPYIQSSEMSKIKAEYNLKRFNKQIKTDEAAA